MKELVQMAGYFGNGNELVQMADYFGNGNKPLRPSAQPLLAAQERLCSTELFVCFNKPLPRNLVINLKYDYKTICHIITVIFLNE
jgi:hypothetical protein